MRAEPWLDEIRHGINQANSFGCDYCATTRRKRDVACWPILLKKSKIQRLRKSREGRFFVVSGAASLCRTGTRTYGCFCVNRCGPSHRRAWDAPAALKKFVRQPKRTFSTVSTQSGHVFGRKAAGQSNWSFLHGQSRPLFYAPDRRCANVGTCLRLSARQQRHPLTRWVAGFAQNSTAGIP